MVERTLGDPTAGRVLLELLMRIVPPVPPDNLSRSIDRFGQPEPEFIAGPVGHLDGEERAALLAVQIILPIQCPDTKELVFDGRGARASCLRFSVQRCDPCA